MYRQLIKVRFKNKNEYGLWIRSALLIRALIWRLKNMHGANDWGAQRKRIQQTFFKGLNKHSIILIHGPIRVFIDKHYLRIETQIN